jgi:hypothetical protein
MLTIMTLKQIWRRYFNEKYPVKTIIDRSGYAGYKSPHGAFYALDGNFCITYQATCRETFGENINSSTVFIGWNKQDINIDSMIEFWLEVANKLNNKDTIPTFYRTQFPDVVVVEMPKFWSECFVKRALFTLLLRAGSVYYQGGEFDSIYKNYDLAALSEKAIRYFLAGNTLSTIKSWRVLNGRNPGWVCEFLELSEAEIAQKLIKP